MIELFRNRCADQPKVEDQLRLTGSERKSVSTALTISLSRGSILSALIDNATLEKVRGRRFHAGVARNRRIHQSAGLLFEMVGKKRCEIGSQSDSESSIADPQSGRLSQKREDFRNVALKFPSQRLFARRQSRNCLYSSVSSA